MEMVYRMAMPAITFFSVGPLIILFVKISYPVHRWCWWGAAGRWQGLFSYRWCKSGYSLTIKAEQKTNLCLFTCFYHRLWNKLKKGKPNFSLVWWWFGFIDHQLVYIKVLWSVVGSFYHMSVKPIKPHCLVCCILFYQISVTPVFFCWSYLPAFIINWSRW